MTAIVTPSDWARLLAGLVLIFALFQWSAATLGSDRGQAGLIVGMLVVAATFAVERLIAGRRLAAIPQSLGLGRPRPAGILVAAAVASAIVIPAFAWVTNSSAAVAPGALSLVPGLFAQAGIAEETLFRGYLFGHLRAGRSFWSAAWLSMLPFVAVHLFLFFTMPWPVALAAVLLSVVISFPLAHLYELGGKTIWAPALLHFAIQGAVKVVTISGDASASFPFVWMAASGILPQLALLVPRAFGSASARFPPGADSDRATWTDP